MFDITTVFFDMGGTLAHPRPSFNGLLAEVCCREGLSVSVEEAARAEPAVWRRIAERPGGGRGFSLSPDRSREFWLWVYVVFLEELGFPEAKHLPERLFAAFTQAENYTLFSDALPALIQLREAGKQVGIISNWEGWATELVTSLGISDLVDFAVVSGTVGYEKPDPEIFELALATAGVSAGQAVHVGDNPLDDVDGALRAGLGAVLIDRTLERHAPVIPTLPALAEPGPSKRNGSSAVTIASLLELPALLGIG